MELIIDGNILMSALISTDGKTFDLIFYDRIQMFAPEFLMEEITKYINEVLSKSGLSIDELELFMTMIDSRIEFIPKSEFNKFVFNAEGISPDPNDVVYFALALKVCVLYGLMTGD
jgi:predicted nucleic acid-binding protein